MSLKLLIDEDSQALPLVKTLRKANHNVLTVNEANLTGQPDRIVLEYATQDNRIVLTRNCRDFKALHEANVTHSGIFAVYQEANPLKKMSRKDIVNAITQCQALPDHELGSCSNPTQESIYFSQSLELLSYYYKCFIIKVMTQKSRERVPNLRSGKARH